MMRTEEDPVRTAEVIPPVEVESALDLRCVLKEAYDIAGVPMMYREYGITGTDTPLWSMVNFIKFGRHTMPSMNAYSLEVLHWAWVTANGYKYGRYWMVNPEGYAHIPRALVAEGETWIEFIARRAAEEGQPSPDDDTIPLPPPQPYGRLFFFAAPTPRGKSGFHFCTFIEMAGESYQNVIVQSPDGIDEESILMDQIYPAVIRMVMDAFPEFECNIDHPTFVKYFHFAFDKHVRCAFKARNAGIINLRWANALRDSRAQRSDGTFPEGTPRTDDLCISITRAYPSCLDRGTLERFPSLQSGFYVEGIPLQRVFCIYKVLMQKSTGNALPIFDLPSEDNMIMSYAIAEQQTDYYLSTDRLTGRLDLVCHIPPGELVTMEEMNEAGKRLKAFLLDEDDQPAKRTRAQAQTDDVPVAVAEQVIPVAQVICGIPSQRRLFVDHRPREEQGVYIMPSEGSDDDDDDDDEVVEGEFDRVLVHGRGVPALTRS